MHRKSRNQPASHQHVDVAVDSAASTGLTKHGGPSSASAGNTVEVDEASDSAPPQLG